MRVSHLAAMATLVALLGAMFVAPGTRADHAPDALGDVNFNTAQCNAGILQGDADANGTYDQQVQVYAADSTPGNDTANVPGFINLTSDMCKAAAGDVNAVNDKVYFSITPNGTETPVITKLSPTAAIRVHDSDGIVKAGTDLTVTISLKTIEDATSAAPTISWVRVSGELDNGTQVGDLELEPSKTPAGDSATATIAIPAGTTSQEYTVSARLTYDHDNVNTTDPKTLTPTAKFTVGDPGTNAASAELTLGNAHDEDPLTSANDVVPEDGVEAASDGDVWLKLSVLNSMGKPANGNGINTVTVIAPGASLSLHPSVAGKPGNALVMGDTPTPGLGSLSGGPNSISAADDDDSVTADVIGQTMFVKVERVAPKNPGTVTVYALVIGSDGAPRSADVDVTFTGSAAAVVLGDGVSVGKPDEGKNAKAEISLGANDAGGADAKLGTVLYSVKDMDGKAVSQSKVKAETSTKGSSTDKVTDDNPNVKVVLVTVDDSAAEGTYTVEASLSGVADSTDMATVTVVGGAKTIVASADNTNPMVGDFVEVEAEVSDADGNPVADGVVVRFTAAGTATVVAVNAISDSNSTATDANTEAGVAKALFYVSRGSGVTSILVTTRDADADPDKVSLIIGTEEEAMPEEEASVSCLSELSGFATWSCGVSADASEIFEMVSARGVSAIHLWNGSTWVRYSVVDDAMVPGSSDFMVTENDILYISN